MRASASRSRAGCTRSATSERCRSSSCATALGWRRSCSTHRASWGLRRWSRWTGRQSPHRRHRAASLHGFRTALDALHFTEITTSKLVETATESGANVFGVDYFGGRAYLAQSPQFFKQIMVGVFERVYTIGPVFRAEPHDTGRHLAEYTSLDVELGFIHDHFDVLPVVRAVVAGMVDAMRDRAPAALELLEVEVPDVPAEIPWLHFSETGVDDVDLAPADERRLCEEQGELLVVTGFPM